MDPIDTGSSRQRRARSGSGPYLDQGWIEMLTAIEQHGGPDFWFPHCTRGADVLHAFVYDIYNSKGVADAPADYSDSIDAVCRDRRGTMKQREGPFVVMFNTSFNFEPNEKVEWRVYLNAPPANGAKLFAMVLDLMPDARYRIVQAKIVASPEEACKRSDVIVIYCDAEANARQVAKVFSDSKVCQGMLGNESVCMAARLGRGVAIGESPTANSGKEPVSFGDLRAAVMSVAVMAATLEMRSGLNRGRSFRNCLIYWLVNFLPEFGLSAQESFRNGSPTGQPSNKSDLAVRRDRAIAQVKQLVKIMFEPR